MIESGKNFDLISEKIAVLRTAIKQAGDQGRLNIHDSCENLVMALINLAYGYRMKNLNENRKNFPGLDIGEEGKVAFQVTSEKTSDKVDETLVKVLRFSHHRSFPSINVFILGEKQGSYTIKTDTTGEFSFSTVENILDFDGLLNKIKFAPPQVIKSILDFLNMELPGTVQKLGNEGSLSQQRFLIDTEDGRAVSKLDFFQHWSCHLKLHGGSYPAPVIYKAL